MLFESPDYFVSNPLALLSPAMLGLLTLVYSMLKIANAISALSKAEGLSKTVQELWAQFHKTEVDCSKAGQLEYAMAMSEACRTRGDIEGQVTWLAFTEQLGKQYTS